MVETPKILHGCLPIRALRSLRQCGKQSLTLCALRVFLTHTYPDWSSAVVSFQTHFCLLSQPDSQAELKPSLVEPEPEPSLGPQTLNFTPFTSLPLQWYPLRRLLCSLIPLIARSIARMHPTPIRVAGFSLFGMSLVRTYLTRATTSRRLKLTIGMWNENIEQE
jgi:hypothetical protein